MSFREQWYSDEQARFLAVLARLCRPLEGSVLEFGSWEGKSTCAIANSVHPQVVTAVDTWQGSADEDPEHVSVKAAKERDVKAMFDSNVRALTAGNIRAVVEDCHRFMEDYASPVKFCHIDASHDYDSVSRSIRAVLPNLVEGGILCGDDFINASSLAPGLNGGVERAVRECLPGFLSRGNLWYWITTARRMALLHGSG
ncbi:MAG: class I SAM-dependent methyltransferase [Armatimonadetes bacterium]|nr:class I SAM-dependent methyltransferase [Armatimonadota bacterium]